MSTAALFRKNDDKTDLFALATAVDTSMGPISAMGAAKALSGVLSWVARKAGALRMQEIAGQLARHEAAWVDGSSMCHSIPVELNGRADENLALIAVVTSALGLFGARNLRAGMAFWATESDPAQWQKIVQG